MAAYRFMASVARTLKASSTFVLFFADVSMKDIPSLSQYSYAVAVSTTRSSSAMSNLLPTTMKGKDSGMLTIDFYRKESLQLLMFSNDQLLVISYTRNAQSAPL